MPVSPLPLLLPLLICIALIYGAIGGWRRFSKALVGIALAVGVILAPFFVSGLILRIQAGAGSSKAQYRYARWLENTPDSLGAIMLWPFPPDVLGGYKWLEKSADGGYPPAIYAQGVRLKHGIHVPEPVGWTGPGGNVFPQPEKGQKLIDKALELGFRTPYQPEGSFYWHVYRGLYQRDPNG